MSGRFKRHISKASTSTGDGNGGGSASGAVARKKRRMENGSSEDEERSFWTPKHLGDLKAYNRSASEAPAELFRKDLISAMKLADNEPLTQEDYWGISDQWKQEWERGVQVPVNPDSLPEPHVSPHKEYPRCSGDFRLPRRFIRVTHSDFFNNEKHVLSNLPTKAEKMCRYDMDNLDDSWLKSYNGERARMGAEPVPHQIFELIIEHFEETCWETIHKLLKAEETLSIEFDEDVICDVCRSPDREEGNEMVFCDICNICVHQACYGITAIPSGSWLCRTCSLGIKPNCDLCPNKGGAMKSTKSGHKWAHVACALWIPEVSIGSVERMEPITKITNIPQSRWALVCVLCRERRGACIQCSVKSCKTAYHVTCAFKHGLEMKAIVEDENADDVKLRSYCEKHSMTNKKDASDAESDNGSTGQKKKKDLTNEQKSQARAAKLRQIEAEFFNHVDALQTSTVLDIDFETTETIFYYWKLKRRAGFNKPLLTPRSQELDLLSQQQEQDIERMKMFVQLRQYLERVRNLCYMVSRREKMSKSFLKAREQTFHKQNTILSNPSVNLNSQEIEAIVQANHGHTVYDKIYSHKGAAVHTQKQFENIVRLIASTTNSVVVKGEDDVTKVKKNLSKDINGLIKDKKKDSVNFKNNPYRKTYFNGAEQRRSRSRSVSHCGSTETSSTEDSDSSLASTKWKPPAPGTRISVFTSSEDEKIFSKNNKSNNNNADSTKSKSSQINLHSSSKFKTPNSSEEDDNVHISQSLPPPSKSIKGKCPVKRGRGRPRGGSKNSSLTKDNSLFSSEEDKGDISPSKFDALIKSTSKISPTKKEDSSKSFIDSSEDDEESKKKLLIKGRVHKKTTPIKQEALSSSEEDLPVTPKPSPPKRGKGRGRGRGSSRQKSLSNNPLSSWVLPSKVSDDDDLGPAIYKLTSEEEDDKSDKSIPINDLSLRRKEKELFGPSSDNKSDVSDNETTPKKEVLTTASVQNKCSSLKSDSDALDSDEGKESGGESVGCNQMKTKAAMKEFTPKIAAKVEKFNSTKRGTRHSLSNEKVKTSREPSEIPLKENAKVVSDLNLFVPQRAAAKKASELITSQNTGIVANCLAPNLVVVPDIVQDGKKQICKPIKDIDSIDPSLGIVTEPTNFVRKSSSHKTRRGRSSKDRLENKDDSDSEPPKKNIFDPPEILPYVPIREAARKAAENLKVKSGSTLTPNVAEEVPELTIGLSPTKLKKTNKADGKPQVLRTTRNKSPRNLNKNINEAESDSDEETESIVSAPIIPKKPLRETSEERIEISKSIFSESEDEALVSPKKDKIVVEKPIEPTKELPHKQQLFRGDIFVCDHQSSSENEDDKGEKHLSSVRGRTSPVKASKEVLGSEHAPKKTEGRNKSHSFRTSRNITRLFGSDDQEEEHETENEEPPAETRRRAPDKKLKTSDGRPEHGFQPPVTARDESRTSPSKQVCKIISPKPTPSEKEEQRLREGRTKCRSRITTSDVPHRDLRSNADAPLANAPPQEAEGFPSRRERELDKGKSADIEEISFKNVEIPIQNSPRRDEQIRGKVQPEESALPRQPKTPKAGPEKGFKSTFECISDPIKEEAPLIRTVTCNEYSKSISHPSIFDFTEKEVEIKRLDDIVESSDTEPEPKKVKITDSDEESVSLVDKKVEQPKDSGYKSAIVTPEPIERVQPICNNFNQSNSLSNDQFPVDVNLSLKKTRLQELQSKVSLPKYTSPGRRKNLEDVIEERKKVAEQTEVALASLDKRNEMPILSSQSFPMQESEMNYNESNEPLAENSQNCSLPISESTSAGSSVSSTSSAPSSFVEVWREQWVKNSQSQPVQMDHMEAPSAYPPLPHHHPGLPPLNDFQYSFMDMQANHYPNNLSVYFNQLRMMQLAFFSQQYGMPPKTHDNQLEEEASMQPDNSAQHTREDHIPRMSSREQLSRLPYEEPQLPLPSKIDPPQIPMRISSPKPDARHVIEPKTVIPLLPPSLPVQAENSANPVFTSDSPLSSVIKMTTPEPQIPEPKAQTSPLPSKPSPRLTHTDSPSIEVSLGISTVHSKMLTTTSTVTTTSSKISAQPTVSPSPAGSKLLESSKHISSPKGFCNDVSLTIKTIKSPIASVISTKSLTHTSGTSVISSTVRITASSPSLTVSSPITSVVTPTTSAAKVICSPLSMRSQEISTVDTSVLQSPPQKRIPIYMQDPKTPKVPEKRSPRTTASSPRWSKQDKKEKKLPAKNNRGKGSRGRGTSKGKRRGVPRFNSASVPKQFVGTVYDFDFDEDFNDVKPANNTLDDLRQLREKRQSIDAIPPPPPILVPQNNTPTYSTEVIKDQPPKKRVKEKKVKSVHKERTPKHEEVDEVAKILEDYRNQQNSTLKLSVHEPSPPQMGLHLELKKLSPPSEVIVTRSPEDAKISRPSLTIVEERKKLDNFRNVAEFAGVSFSTASVVTSLHTEDRTNQLKLKIKGPYANSYPNSNLNAPIQEMSLNPTPQSTTTTLRRMRKKELIRQYCYQDMNPEQGESNATSNSSNPPQQLRTGITLPKAVASMTSIPTREDYKMYTQDDISSRSGNSSRRRRQPRELKHLDWTLLEDKGKRNPDSGQDGSRKRARAAKESSKRPQTEEKEMPLPGKLRISLGKKGSEISQVTNIPSIIESREMINSKGKPPKKRHPEESTIMKVKSDNLKFREEIMANFDRSGNSKNGVGEKKSKKRRLVHMSEDGNSPLNSELKDEEMKVVKNVDSRKLVLKFSKKSDNGLCGIDDRINGGNLNNKVSTQPLKIRIGLGNRSKGQSSEQKEGSCENGPSRPSSRERIMMPLKLKLQRRPEGYVTSKSTQECPMDEGPGPPPEPPDPPSSSRSKQSFPHYSTSTILPPPKDVSLCKATTIEHRDRESLPFTQGEILPLTSQLPSRTPPHSRISEDVLQQLEAQLAATDGGIPLPSLPPVVNTSNPSNLFLQSAPPNSFSALQAVPTLKDESGCR